MDSELRRQLYDNYREWKKWEEGDTSLDRSNVFAKEIRRANIQADARILEVGFGQGLFLDWAKSSGYHPVGIEIDPAAVQQATGRGHQVYLSDIRDVCEHTTSDFDLIVLFDVLEHMTLAELVAVFKLFSRILKPTGRVLARFPNGGSPFGRLYQYGDATHQTVLTGSLIHQIALTAGMQLIAQYDAARSLVPKDRKGLKNIKIAVKLVYWICDLVTSTMSLMFFGKRIPMSPTMTVLVGKKIKSGWD